MLLLASTCVFLARQRSQIHERVPLPYGINHRLLHAVEALPSTASSIPSISSRSRNKSINAHTLNVHKGSSMTLGGSAALHAKETSEIFRPAGDCYPLQRRSPPAE